MARADGIVIESGRGWALIMNHEGRYLKIKTAQPLYPGQHYYAAHRPVLRYGIAAAVLLLLLAGTADFFNVVAYASVSPGIDLGINRWDRVVAVKTDSDEAAQVVSGLDISGKTSTEAVATVVNEIIVNNQVPEGSSGNLNITVHSKKDDQGLGVQYRENLVARISLSVDEVMQVHQQVKVKHDMVGESVNIHYQVLPAGIAKKEQDRRDTDSESTNGNGAAGHNHDTANNQVSPKADRAVPVTKPAVDWDKFDGIRSRQESPAQERDNTSKPETEKYKKGFTKWWDNKGQIDWPGFHKVIKPGQEKQDK